MGNKGANKLSASMSKPAFLVLFHEYNFAEIDTAFQALTTANYPKILLTMDEDPEAQCDGIRHINARDWLLI